MLVPVWSATWEVECCQPEAEVGGEWPVPIAFAPEAPGAWIEEFATVPSEQRTLGTVRLEATIVRAHAGDGDVLMAAGPLRFRAAAGTPEGVLVGHLFVDAHSADETVGNHEVLLGGTVERIELVPLRYTKRDGMFVPTAQLDPVAVGATLERDRLYPDHFEPDAEERVQPQLLVWVRA